MDEESYMPGCNCAECLDAKKKAKNKAKDVQAEENMSQEAYNLARISRGEEGKTAYFFYLDWDVMPNTIAWLWPDGFFSVHAKKTGSGQVLDTTKEWWDSHVLNAAWPSNELIEDLYSDVFVPRQTRTRRYNMVENEKKYHKTTSTNLHADPEFVSAMVSRMHNVKDLIDLIDEWTNKPKPKKAPAKTGNTPKPKKAPAKIKFDDLDAEEDPFGDLDEDSKVYKTATGKVSIYKLDGNGNPVGPPLASMPGNSVHNTGITWNTNLPLNGNNINGYSLTDQQKLYMMYNTKFTN